MLRTAECLAFLVARHRWVSPPIDFFYQKECADMFQKVRWSQDLDGKYVVAKVYAVQFRWRPRTVRIVEPAWLSMQRDGGPGPGLTNETY